MSLMAPADRATTLSGGHSQGSGPGRRCLLASGLACVVGVVLTRGGSRV